MLNSNNICYSQGAMALCEGIGCVVALLSSVFHGAITRSHSGLCVGTLTHCRMGLPYSNIYGAIVLVNLQLLLLVIMYVVMIIVFF